MVLVPKPDDLSLSPEPVTGMNMLGAKLLQGAWALDSVPPG